MTPDQFRQHADDAYEAIRAMNHSAIDTAAIPAPEVYSVLGHLIRLGQSVSELTDHLARCLAGSLDPAVGYDVYDRDMDGNDRDMDGNDRDPEASVEEAGSLLRTAADQGRAMRSLLSAAQVAINGQGYRLSTDEDDDAADVERVDAAGTVEIGDDQ